MFPLGEGGQPIVAPAAITTFTPETTNMHTRNNQLEKVKNAKNKNVRTKRKSAETTELKKNKNANNNKC